MCPGTYGHCNGVQRHMVIWRERREIMWRSARARRSGVRLPTYDHPHVAPHNSPAFGVDRTQAEGGVCEQTNLALLNYIYSSILYYITMVYCSLPCIYPCRFPIYQGSMILGPLVTIYIFTDTHWRLNESRHCSGTHVMHSITMVTI